LYGNRCPRSQALHGGQVAASNFLITVAALTCVFFSSAMPAIDEHASMNESRPKEGNPS
jgi:hypothetical protein